jgi:translocator protein
MNKWVALAAFVILCLAVGASAGYFTAQSVATWFPTLNKPFFNPPSWVFAPVWTTLYIMMAVAAWLIWLNGNSRHALILFYIQLAFNFAWPFLFFAMHAIALALIEIIVMWVLIVATLLAFRKISKPAGWLLAPYLAWVSFATILNASFWWLN